MNVYIQKISSYNLSEIKEYISTALQNINFWEKIKDKNTILLKPNLLGAFEPEKAVTTHPVIIEALIQMLQEHKKEVLLGDSPGGTVFLENVWEKTGIKALCEKYKVKLLNFSEGGISEYKTSNKTYTITDYFFAVDAVINLPKYKTHSLMYYTGAIKNLYGLIPGLKKSDFHKSHPTITEFSEVITELYSIVKSRIVLNILDGIWGMEGEGPSAGNPRNFGLLFLSESASALDKIASKMLGFSASQLKYVHKALEIDNLTANDVIVTPEWKDFKFNNVKIKKISNFIKILSYSPEFMQKIFEKLHKYNPAFNEKCRLCMVCVNSCPVKAITVKKGEKTPRIDYDKCIKCMCCHELCPYQAVYIKKSFLAKFILK